MLIAKIIFLQVFWFVAVSFGPKGFSLPIWIGAFVFAAANYFIYKPKISQLGYAFVLLIFAFWGFAQDNLLMVFGILELNQYPLWLNSLYVVFIGYYGDIFNYLRINPLLQALLGGAGGAFAYYSGWKLGSVVVLSGQELNYLGFVFISWALFFPLSFYVFYNRNPQFNGKSPA